MNGLLPFLAGLALLVVGAEFVVRGAARLAALLGIRPIVLGLTVVAIGTSMPELAVGIAAGLQGSGALAVGNIAGTNLVNLLLILGLSAALRPLPLHKRTIRFELPVMIAAAALMSLLAWNGVLSRLDGAVLIGAGVLYTAALVRETRRESAAVRREFREAFGDAPPPRAPGARDGVLQSGILLAGIALSVAGAELLVDGAVLIARSLGLTEAMIGLTIVAIGTSAPELVTTIVATVRNERDVAVGNLLGSSIYNILAILGLTCLATPGGLPVERSLLLFDLPLMTAVALACVPVFITDREISRREGAFAMALYLAYMLFLFLMRPL